MNSNNQPTTGKEVPPIVNPQKPEEKKTLPVDTASKKPVIKKEEPKKVPVTQPEEEEEDEPATTTPPASTETPEAKPASKALGLYTVDSKAFFHNEPNESTRRAANINKWNNAILAALDDKNGFIYVVYTNAEGQTSKGWLNKSDLTRINR